MSTQAPTAVLQAARTPQLTTKQRLLVHGLASGLSMIQATKQAGMERTAGYRALENVREVVPELMREIGLDARSVLLKVRDLTEATKTVVASAEGEFTDTMEIADNQARAKGIELAADLLGLTQRESGVSIGTVNVLWAGGSPTWANGHVPVHEHEASAEVEAAPTPTLSQRVRNASVNVRDTCAIPLSNDTHTLAPEVQLKVLDRTGGAPGHTHSGNFDDGKCVNTGATTAFASVPLRNFLVKEKRKRKPRLPGWRQK